MNVRVTADFLPTAWPRACWPAGCAPWEGPAGLERDLGGAQPCPRTYRRVAETRAPSERCWDAAKPPGPWGSRSPAGRRRGEGGGGRVLGADGGGAGDPSCGARSEKIKPGPGASAAGGRRGREEVRQPDRGGQTAWKLPGVCSATDVAGLYWNQVTRTRPCGKPPAGVADRQALPSEI